MSSLVEANAAVMLRDVSVFYGEVVGLSGVSLSVGAGILGLVGPNGSGKSTLMRVITGCIPTQEGTAEVLQGNPFTDAGVRQRVAIVPTPECFARHISGRRNLELAFLARGLGRKDARDAAGRALALAGLEGDGDRDYGTWSRGMRQRLKLGLVLALDAEVVLLDEPHLGVDPPNRRRLRDLISALGASGRTVLMASHVLGEVESLTRRIAVLMHGRLLGVGDVDVLVASLRDRHPHHIRIVAPAVRRLAALLVGLNHVVRLDVRGDDELELVSARPDQAYLDLAGAIAKANVAVREVTSDDDSLDAVFRSLTEAGARHLRDVP